MKKKLIPILLLLLLILGGAFALALGGSMQDPLISLDYLDNQYKPSLLGEVGKKADAVDAVSYQAAEKRLEAEADRLRALANTDDAASSDWQYRATVQPQKYSYGDTMTLGEGAGLLFLEGSALAKVENGEIINASDGTSGRESNLQPGNHYLVGEGATVTLTVLSEAAIYAPVSSYRETISGESALPFTDLNRTMWYHNAVQFVYDRKLFQGVSADHFEPAGSVTRGMLATILHRLAGEPDAQGSDSVFADVASGAWYAPGVVWSAANDVVNGMGDGKFMPNDNVTREQLAVMLHRYARSYAGLENNAPGDLARFTDKRAVSDWAEEGLSWAVGVGILNGDDRGALNPAASASRAETATMMSRFAALLPE